MRGDIANRKIDWFSFILGVLLTLIIGGCFASLH
jgi:hypothetical protein